MSSGGSYRHSVALALSVFALLSVTLYAALGYAVWTLNTQNDNLEKQNAVLNTQTANLEKQMTELREFVYYGATPGSTEPGTVMNTLKRMVKREVLIYYLHSY